MTIFADFVTEEIGNIFCDSFGDESEEQRFKAYGLNYNSIYEMLQQDGLLDDDEYYMGRFAWSTRVLDYLLFRYAFFYSNYRFIFLDHGEKAESFEQSTWRSLPQGLDALYQLITLSQRVFLPIYTHCLSQHPHPKIHYERGMLYMHQGMYMEALEEMQNVVSLAKEKGMEEFLSSEMYQTEGAFYAELGLYDEAIKSLSLAINQDPKNQEAYFERALAYFELGKFDLSFDDFLKSKPEKKRSQINDLEYAKKVIQGLKRGADEGAAEFIPSLLASIKSMNTALWSSVLDENVGLESLLNDPSSYLNLFLTLSKECASIFSRKVVEKCSDEAVQEKIDEWGEFIQTHSVDDAIQWVQDVAKNVDATDPDQLGEKVGYIIGKYGIEGLAMAIPASALKGLKYANKALTFELCEESLVARETIMSQALKKQGMRELISAESCAHRLVNANRAIIKDKKILEYCLNPLHNTGADKAIPK